MIIWLASYPIYGNSWLRSLISAYYYSNDGIFLGDDHFKNVDTWYSNVDTTFGNPEANKLPFQRFIKSAITGLNEYLEHFEIDAPIRYGVECWLNRYKQNYHQEVHNHAGRSIISCAYMLKTPPDSGNFVFYRKEPRGS